MAYADQMKETMELKITKARNAHSKALKEASEFEFVAGGVNDVDQNRLTGAQIDLGEIPIAALRGIHMFPLMDCNDIHQYCNSFTTEMLENAFLMLQNAGLTENPQFRGVPVHKRLYRNYKTESKAEMIVRFFEVITPANNLLPESVQELKSQIEQTASRNAKRAAAKAAAEEEMMNACSLSNDTSKVKISSKKRKSVLEFKTTCSPEAKKRRSDPRANRFTPSKESIDMNNVGGISSSFTSPLPLPSSAPWKTGDENKEYNNESA